MHARVCEVVFNMCIRNCVSHIAMCTAWKLQYSYNVDPVAGTSSLTICDSCSDCCDNSCSRLIAYIPLCVHFRISNLIGLYETLAVCLKRYRRPMPFSSAVLMTHGAHLTCGAFVCDRLPWSYHHVQSMPISWIKLGSGLHTNTMQGIWYTSVSALTVPQSLQCPAYPETKRCCRGWLTLLTLALELSVRLHSVKSVAVRVDLVGIA